MPENLPAMRLRLPHGRWVRIALLIAICWAFPHSIVAQSAPPAAEDAGWPQARSSPTVPEDEFTEIQSESAERDVTYLKSRLVYRYDYKSQVGDVFVNRFRLKSLFAFGPQKRLGVAITLPVVQKSTEGVSSAGFQDLKAQFGGNIYHGDRFRHGAAVEFTFQTSTDKQIGGSTTTAKPAWGFTAVLTRRIETNCVFNYNRSIHTTRGSRKNEFEPDCTFNTRRLGMTWYAEWDSYYLLDPGQLAQTVKVGTSRGIGKGRRWVISPYYSFPPNGPGRQTQYIHQVGMDITWFFSPLSEAVH